MYTSSRRHRRSCGGRFINFQGEHLLGTAAHALCGFFNHVSALTGLIKRARAGAREAPREEFPDSFHAESNWISRSGTMCISARGKETLSRRDRSLWCATLGYRRAFSRRCRAPHFVTSPLNNRFIKIHGGSDETGLYPATRNHPPPSYRRVEIWRIERDSKTCLSRVVRKF